MWFKVDDRFHSSRKMLAIPRRIRLAAVGLWAIAGSWTAGEELDGLVPDYMVEEWGGTDELVEALVRAGLWVPVDGGTRFANWAEWQPTREQLDEKRENDRSRKAEWRRRKAASASRHNGTDAGQTRDSHGTDTIVPSNPTRPDPTRPIEEANASSTSPRGDGGFAEFYLAYPRKVGKDAARRAFEKAAKSSGPEVIIAGARRFAADPNLPDKQFIPHPATWLNAGRWDDEPLPPRSQGPMLPPPEDFGQDEWLFRS